MGPFQVSCNLSSRSLQESFVQRFFPKNETNKFGKSHFNVLVQVYVLQHVNTEMMLQRTCMKKNLHFSYEQRKTEQESSKAAEGLRHDLPEVFF